MKQLPTYRALALALAMVFLIFNIGLPIIVASCPMVSMPGQSVCTMCSDQSSSATEKITIAKDKSCCATVIAAKRNTNEFVQSNHIVQDVSKVTFSVIASMNLQLLDNALLLVHGVNCSTSPPLARDIPVLTSSLLI